MMRDMRKRNLFIIFAFFCYFDFILPDIFTDKKRSYYKFHANN